MGISDPLTAVNFDGAVLAIGMEQERAAYEAATGSTSGGRASGRRPAAGKKKMPLSHLAGLNARGLKKTVKDVR
jgi:hypothetical protein